MATAAVAESEEVRNSGLHASIKDLSDPFADEQPSRPSLSQTHRYSSLVNPNLLTLAASTSPSQVRRSIVAHLAETERRLHDTQKLGESLLQQQSDLSEKLREVEEQQGEAEITPELRTRLAELEKEHNDVGKEIARALLVPKSRAVSGEDKPAMEQSTFSSQATASPSKVTAPSRRQRNQPSTRAGDLQFAADISTSLLAQVRQLQSAVAERDDLLKQANSERDRLEKDALVSAQRLRALDESEQKYKDENWNLETQTHELLAATREAGDREKRLTASLAAAAAEKSRMQSEMDEIRLLYEKLTEDHAMAKKAHDSELHTLKRTIDVAESERISLQQKIEELTSQNHELARAVSARLRTQQPEAVATSDDHDEEFGDMDALEHSPPPSPTKATPRPGALESETLRSSLHHAHRMIQNLKNNIHREKTEKIELKRMLQDARDELEQRRGDGSLGSGNKRPKPKAEASKKPPRPDMLGGLRRSRTDVELEDDDWEDHLLDTPTRGHRQHHLAPSAFVEGRTTDTSDAYQTATETEGGAFETADERHATESEDFQTGAESLAGDSTDDLTETEDTASQSRRGPSRATRPSFSFKPAANRLSLISTASTSAGEEEGDLKTPILAQTQKFRLRNGRQSFARQSRVPTESTPTNLYSDATSQESPATVSSERSPPGAEQSLFAELGGFDETAGFGTPGRSSLASLASTPAAAAYTPSRGSTVQATPGSIAKASMVDSGTMTEPWQPEQGIASAVGPAEAQVEPPSPHRDQAPSPLPSDFPLPPTVPTSPIKQMDSSTQYTPQRAFQDSPIRSTAFITPPKTVWDEAQSPEILHTDISSPHHPQTPRRHEFSGLLTHETKPMSPEEVLPQMPRQVELLTFSAIQAQATEPVQTPRKEPFSGVAASTQVDDLPSQHQTAQKAATAGLFASAASVLGFAKSKEAATLRIAEDETNEPENIPKEDVLVKDLPLKDVSGNSGPSRAMVPSDDLSELKARHQIPSGHDQGSQTLLTAEEIEAALRHKSLLPIPLSEDAEAIETGTSPLSPLTPMEIGEMPGVNPVVILKPTDVPPIIGIPSPAKRPSSASGQRLSSSGGPHPPLPLDHKQAIAKASGQLASPTNEVNSSSHTSTVMGPPALPASAMRRPRTPGGSIRSPTRESNAPRTSNVSRGQRATLTSQLSHRSSVSSFASELEERFNIHPQGQGAGGFSTDPRIIQAITQTMIGEYLWKYTRKAGRSEMSETRHRRYFWVHPYTKTLYWSDQDPQTAGRTELKAKSVLIESVHVVPDDNPMPPGLHRKSLEVITPGRRLRFTASTGQRHETWLNALTYLLHRQEDPATANYDAGGNEITRDDIDEFNVHAGGYGAALVASGSGMSLSSYNSRTTRGTVSHRNSANQRHTLTPGGVATRSSTRLPPPSTTSRNPSPSTVRRSRAEQSHEADQDRTLRASSASRFSRMIGSVTGRTSRTAESMTMPGGARSEGGSIYDASLVSDGRKDSAEELRKEMLRQEELAFGGLENVRACCDGKHDVSTLSHSLRHATPHGHGHRSLSMSLRGSTRRRDGPSSSNTAVAGLGPSSPTRTSATASAY